MSAPIGDPGGLRALAASWATAATVDSAAMDSLLNAGVSATAAVEGAEGAGGLLSGVTAPGGSLDGAGRLLASASSILLTYADELEQQQTRWSAGQLALERVALAESLQPTTTPLEDMAALRAGEPTRLADLSAQRAAAVEDTGAADAAAAAAAATAAVELSTVAAQLELLAARTVTVGGAPTAVPAAPSIGQVPAGVGPTGSVQPMLIPHWAAPPQTAQWWSGLTPSQQQALIAADPDWVGQADGLPSEARDSANQVLLARDLARYDKTLDVLRLDRSDVATEEGMARTAVRLRGLGWSESEISTAMSTWAVARQTARAREQVPSDTIQLVVYDPGAFNGKGRAAIAVGDLDSAPNIAVIVPGTGADVPTYLDDQLDDGLALKASADSYDIEGAVLINVGYAAPPHLGSALSMSYADEGADHIADDVSGLTASRASNPAAVTLIGFSYGATVVATAADRHELELAALVLAESPGAGTASTVADFEGVTPERVFVLADSDDPVTQLGSPSPNGFPGPLGLDPAHEDFHAVRLHAETDTWGIRAHDMVYAPGQAPLYNLTMLMGQRYGQVIPAEPRTTEGHDRLRRVVDPEAGREPELPTPPPR